MCRRWGRMIVVVCLVMWSLSAMSSQLTTLSVVIGNTYTGHLSIVAQSWSWIRDDSGVLRTDQSDILVEIVSSVASSYLIVGDFTWSPLTGSVDSPYRREYRLSLNQSDDPSLITWILMRDQEPLVSVLPRMMVDHAPPSMPILLSDPNTTILSPQWNWLVRSWSIDSGVWISHYELFVWLQPWIDTMVALLTQQTWVLLSHLPEWTLYVAVVAVDLLGNRSSYEMSYIHHNYPTRIDTPSWQWSINDVDRSSSTASSNEFPTINQSNWSDDGNVFNAMDNTTHNSPSIPVYVVDGERISQETRVLCSARSIYGVVWCRAWDDFISYSRLPRSRRMVWDNFDAPVIQYRQVAMAAEMSVLAMASWWDASISLPRDIATTRQQEIWFGVTQQLYRSLGFSSSIADPIVFESYDPICSEIGYCIEKLHRSAWSDHYEQLILRTGEPLTPYTVKYAFWTMFLVLCIWWLTWWFFAWWYRHMYRIRYK